MSYADLVRERMQQRQMTTGDLAGTVGHSYEHCRRMLVGASTVSRQFNKAICEALGLSERKMWAIATREKATARFGADVLAGVLDPQDKAFFALWRRLDRADQALVKRIVEALSAKRRSTRPDPSRS